MAQGERIGWIQPSVRNELIDFPNGVLDTVSDAELERVKIGDRSPFEECLIVVGFDFALNPGEVDATTGVRKHTSQQFVGLRFKTICQIRRNGFCCECHFNAGT